MGFEVYVAGPLDYPHEKEQMNDIIYALHMEYGISDEHDVKLIVDIPRDTANGCGKQIDGILIKDDEIVIIELKGYSGHVKIRFDPALEERRKEGELSWSVYYKAQPKWKVDGEIPPQTQNPIDQVGGQRYHFIRVIENEMQKAKGFNPKNKIRNWIVINSRNISYESETTKDHLKESRTWMRILQQKDFIKELNYLGKKREPPRKIMHEMFSKMLNIVNAEKRPYHRWLSERLLSEHYELSRVPYLDYYIESDNPNRVLDAIKSVERYRLRAYTDDLVNLFYGSIDSKIKDETLGLLIDWEYEGLEDILVQALEGPTRSQYYRRALDYLASENYFSATVPQLESILNDGYELQSYWEVFASIKAIRQSGTRESGEILKRFLDKHFGNDPCSKMIEELEKDAEIIMTRFNGNEISKKQTEMLTEAIKGLGQCHHHSSLDYLLKIVRDFPYDAYEEAERTMHGPSPGRHDFRYASVKCSCLGNIFLSTLQAIGELWDGRPLDPLTNRFSIIHSGIVHDQNKDHPLLDLYKGILNCLKWTGDSTAIPFLADKLDDFPHPENDYPDWFWNPRREIVDTISGIGGEGTCGTLIQVLRKYYEIYRQAREEHEYHPYSDIIIDIINHLGELECKRASKELIPFLEEDSSDLVLIREAVRTLGKMKAADAFDRLMTMFLEHQYGDYRALENSLVSIDPKRCENRLLERFEDATELYQISPEASMLERVATKDSIPLLFKLAKDLDWYNYVLPKRIIDFMDDEDIVEEVEDMLGSNEPHQRSFAIEMFTMSQHWGDRTDDELEMFEDDASPMVRRMVLDLYAHRGNLKKTLRYLDDQDIDIKNNCYQKLHMFLRNEISGSIIASWNEWIDIHNVIITDDIIAFCKHYWLYETDEEELIDDELGAFYFKFNDIKDVRHVTAILKLEDVPRLVELIYIEMEQEDVNMKLLIIPEFEEQIKGWGDLFGPYVLFTDELKKKCHNLIGSRVRADTIEDLLREIISNGFLGTSIRSNAEVKFR